MESEVIEMLLIFSVWAVSLLCPDEFDAVSEERVPSLVLSIWIFLIVWLSSIWVFFLGGYS